MMLVINDDNIHVLDKAKLIYHINMRNTCVK